MYFFLFLTQHIVVLRFFGNNFGNIEYSIIAKGFAIRAKIFKFCLNTMQILSGT